tara:strand:+ start:23930 stop:25180 length:1251 start_codon:yes stop_codon:yes gene_type:complete
MDYIDSRCSGEFEARHHDEDEYSNERFAFNRDVGVATIDITGPLSYKPVTMFGMDCGGVSYENLKEDVSYLASEGVNTIAFLVDSGGGEAHQMIQTAKYIRAVADQHNIKLISYVDGMSASAAYGLSVVSDEIILSEGSEVGSIGVLVRLMNDSKKLEKEGYERTFVTAGEEKVPFNADGSFREEFIKDIQYKVDSLYTEFTEFVAEHRGISVEAVRSTQARTFLPKESIELGLADSVMSVEEFYTYLADTAQTKEGRMKKPVFKLSNEKEKSEMNEEAIVEMQAKLEEATASVQATNEKLASVVAQLQEKETALAEAASQIAKMEEDKETAKTEARKAKLAAVLGEDKVEETLSATASLSDDAFAVVLKGYDTQKKALENSDLFKEMGSQGEEMELETEQAEDLTAAILKKQYTK